MLLPAPHSPRGALGAETKRPTLRPGNAADRDAGFRADFLHRAALLCARRRIRPQRRWRPRRLEAGHARNTSDRCSGKSVAGPCARARGARADDLQVPRRQRSHRVPGSCLCRRATGNTRRDRTAAAGGAVPGLRYCERTQVAERSRGSIAGAAGRDTPDRGVVVRMPRRGRRGVLSALRVPALDCHRCRRRARTRPVHARQRLGVRIGSVADPRGSLPASRCSRFDRPCRSRT